MARIWQEGFEDGLPNSDYLEGVPDSQNFYSSSLVKFPNGIGVSSGRNSYSTKSLRCFANNAYLTKELLTPLSELYLRCYTKFNAFTTNVSTVCEIISLIDTSGNIVLSIYDNTNGSFSIKSRENGVYATVHTFTPSLNTWYKFDLYLKTNTTSGAYEIKIDDVTIKTGSDINTGSASIKTIKIGNTTTNANSISDLIFDDIALNDTTGSSNNSWCGSGTIVALKPKGSGNSTQWDTCEGYAYAESGTGTTTIKVTGHGLATNDVIYNKTRDTYRIVTVTDANTLTVSSVTSQAQNDVILLYNVQSTISATATTSTSQVTLAGHNLTSGDVIVNTTRSNAIRKVIYVSSNVIYNYYDVAISPPNTLGTTITSQASGDSIKTFKFKPYAITNHWEAVSNNADPSPKLSYIRTTTINDVDTFDMQELTADLGIPSGASIVAVSHNIYAQEAGAGSEIKPVFRIGSTDYAGDTKTLSSGTLQYQKIYETSPATSTAWTRSEIDGLEAGVKLV